MLLVCLLLEKLVRQLRYEQIFFIERGQLKLEPGPVVPGVASRGGVRPPAVVRLRVRHLFVVADVDVSAVGDVDVTRRRRRYRRRTSVQRRTSVHRQSRSGPGINFEKLFRPLSGTEN